MTADVLRVVNLLLGSVMMGTLWFGAVVMPMLHAEFPVRASSSLQHAISRRVDWVVPPSIFLTLVTGFVLLLVDREATNTASVLTLVGVVSIASYVLPFLIHPTGGRNEIAFLRGTVLDLEEAEGRRRQRWWLSWHYYRTALCTAAQACFVVAAVVR